MNINLDNWARGPSRQFIYPSTSPQRAQIFFIKPQICGLAQGVNPIGPLSASNPTQLCETSANLPPLYILSSCFVCWITEKSTVQLCQVLFSHPQFLLKGIFFTSKSWESRGACKPFKKIFNQISGNTQKSGILGKWFKEDFKVQLGLVSEEVPKEYEWTGGHYH